MQQKFMTCLLVYNICVASPGPGPGPGNIAVIAHHVRVTKIEPTYYTPRLL